MMRSLAAITISLLSLVARPAIADEAVIASTSLGYVHNADATVKGKSGDHYRFQGAMARAGLFIAAPEKKNQFYGIFGSSTALINRYTDNDANETMTIRDLGFAWLLASPAVLFDLELGAGLSTVKVEQKDPTPRQDTYKTGYMVSGAFEIGVYGSRAAHILIRGEANYRGYSDGKDALAPDTKLLPFTVTSFPICLGAELRF